MIHAIKPKFVEIEKKTKAMAARRKAAAAPPVVPAGQLPVIVIDVDERRENDAAVKALAAEPDLYQRGGLLVTVTAQTKEPGPAAVVRRPVGAPLLRELSRPLLRERMAHCARWERAARGKEDKPPVPAHPPTWAVDAVHARGEWPGLKRLDAVLPHPALLPDGTLLAADGYHPDHGILVRLPAGLRVDVPDRPTASEVKRAVDALLDPLADFPFETPAHRAALLAGLLTPLAWFLFDGPAPLFLIDKNVRGAGAGLLADVVALTLTGRRFPVVSYTHDPDELRKRITTLAVEGERLVLLDNLTGAFGNGVLDAALTADRWKDRLLGGNRSYDGPLHVVWFGTGNNVMLGADTARRVCHVRMESAEERSEFRHPDLRAHVLGCRGRLLSVALTLLRGWLAAGKPQQNLKPWGSFEGWSGVVRECVVWAGLPDPGETRRALQASADTDDQAMRGIIAGWRQGETTGHGLTTSQMVQRVKDDTSSEWAAGMRDAIEHLCGKLDARLLGNKLRHFKKRNFGGWCMDKAGECDGTTRWTAKPMNSEPAGNTPLTSRTSPPALQPPRDVRDVRAVVDAGSESDDGPADGGFHFGIDDPDDQRLPD